MSKAYRVLRDLLLQFAGMNIQIMKWNRYLPQFLRGRRQLTRHLAIATSIIVEIFSSSSQPDTSASERFLGRMSKHNICREIFEQVLVFVNY